MYAITYKRNNLTITVKAEEISLGIFNAPRRYYVIHYSGYYMAVYEDEIISIKPYKARTKQRSY